MVNPSKSILRGNIRVVARIRPRSSKELQNSLHEDCFRGLEFSPTNELSAPQAIEAILPGSDDNRWFDFDAVFDKQSSQKEVYERSGAKEAVCESIFGGFNCTILAYGQTGSGKTYSMGSTTTSTRHEGFDPQLCSNESVGIIPRACHDLFEQVKEKCHGNASVSVSYLELYNESLHDLLASNKTKESLRIRETVNGEVLVSGLTSHSVTSPQEVAKLMKNAYVRRVVASTAMNTYSSRSHAICVIRVNGCTNSCHTFSSKLTFVDLAGSERMKKSGVLGNQRKEGISINKSLFVLGQVVAALSNQKKSYKPPYRDSKLTRLLQDSLGGNCRTILLACVSPVASSFEESINTLRYAAAARNIENAARCNTVHPLSPEEFLMLKRENIQLKNVVEQLQRKVDILTASQPLTMIERLPISETSSLDTLDDYDSTNNFKPQSTIRFDSVDFAEKYPDQLTQTIPLGWSSATRHLLILTACSVLLGFSPLHNNYIFSDYEMVVTIAYSHLDASIAFLANAVGTLVGCGAFIFLFTLPPR